MVRAIVAREFRQTVTVLIFITFHQRELAVRTQFGASNQEISQAFGAANR